jgi:hypothetical protein
MKIKHLLVFLFSIIMTTDIAVAQPSTQCKPHPEGAAKLIEIRPRFHTVGPEFADFDPCHRSVEFKVPTKFLGKPLDVKPPLVIIAHGGGGALPNCSPWHSSGPH